LALRINSENYAQTVMDSSIFHYIWEMLESPDPEARASSYQLLNRLALYEFTIPHILKMRTCDRLVALLE
jgi:hypothetical protein